MHFRSAQVKERIHLLESQSLVQRRESFVPDRMRREVEVGCRPKCVVSDQELGNDTEEFCGEPRNSLYE
jgi:hypothetical protein